MGRILEALMHGARKPSSGTRAEPLPVAPAVPTPPEIPESDDIPFVEVGGPGTITNGPPPEPRTFTPAVPNPGKPTVLSPPETASVAPAVMFQPADRASVPLAPAGRRFAAPLIAFHQPDHPVSEQYRALLAGLKRQLRTEGSQVAGLMAPVSGVGATTVLLNLAITQARLDTERVVVVDANLRRPAVAECLGLPAAPGLREVVGRCVPLRRALQATGQLNCWALTAGEPLSSGSRWPCADALRATLDQLREQFDWVLVDVPSWDGGAELLALAAACDGIFLVLRPADLDSPEVRAIGRLLPPLGSGLSGFILTER